MYMECGGLFQVWVARVIVAAIVLLWVIPDPKIEAAHRAFEEEGERQEREGFRTALLRRASLMTEEDA